MAALVLREGHGHSYSLGDCPVIDPMTPFSMERMLGVWYVIQKTSTASTCITYNFTKLDEPDNFQLEQTSQHFILGLTPLAHEYHYTGRLSVPDSAVPARMKVKFPLNVLGKASFTVFMTDYDTFAAVYTCQGLGIGHRDSATILSRTRTLDKVFVDKVRSRLASYNIDPFDLSIISQRNCPKNKNGTNGLNIDIDDDTFSAHSVAGVIRKAGGAIGDGVEYVAGGAKRIYSTVSNSDGTQNEGQKIEDAAEYIAGGARRGYASASDKIEDGAEYVETGGRKVYSDVVKSGRMEMERPNPTPSASEWLP